MKAIIASARLETSTSGSTMLAVPSRVRKVIRHSTMMAAKTHISIGNCAADTASLVAAMTPTFPVASRNLRSSEPCFSRKALTALTTRSMVFALWSSV